ncbi:MAG TPA: SET domain-containing protein [Pyrinomonadaceae bacterium]|jgi:SET domain-containing protein|nr:SET domain-containing protein [Pyrinomonadaceae bacterium]
MTQTSRDKFALRRTETGLGLFTLQAIPAGKRIVEYVGPIVTTEEVDRRGGKYFFELDANFAIDGSPRTNIARYINHSCRPNAEAFVARKRVWIWSRKNIKAGEQLTLNYGKAYFEEHIKPIGCKCEKCAAPRKAKQRSRKKSG